MDNPNIPLMDHDVYEWLGNITLPPSQTFAPFVIKPSFKSGPWIAGGAPKTWMKQKQVKSDVDVYCSSEEQHNMLITRLTNYGFYKHFDTKNAITMRYNQHDDKNTIDYDVQLIKKEFFNHPYDVLDSYDFGQCQLVTDGYQVYGNPKWDSQELQIQNYKSDTILKRFMKYYAYGYDVPPGTLTEWSMDQDLCYDFQSTDDY